MIPVLLSDLAVEQLKEMPPGIGQRLLDALDRLRIFPEAAPRLTIQNYEGYRHVIVHPYRAVYRYLPDEN
jgi:uncharacterized protein YutE (UPF0331/DUF86 family)